MPIGDTLCVIACPAFVACEYESLMTQPIRHAADGPMSSRAPAEPTSDESSSDELCAAHAYLVP